MVRCINTQVCNSRRSSRRRDINGVIITFDDDDDDDDGDDNDDADADADAGAAQNAEDDDGVNNEVMAAVTIRWSSPSLCRLFIRP